jgi:hypothetical protein
MIDLDAMDKDPWPTWPVDKMELRILVEENEKLRAANFYLCSRVDYLPYCHEIERLRAALHEWDALIEHQYSGSREAMSDMTYAAQRTAHLLHGDPPWPEPRRAALGEASDDAAT